MDNHSCFTRPIADVFPNKWHWHTELFVNLVSIKHFDYVLMAKIRDLKEGLLFSDNNCTNCWLKS